MKRSLLPSYLSARRHQPLSIPLRPISPWPGSSRRLVLHEPARNVAHGRLKRICPLLRLLETGGHERLLEIVDDVFDSFQAGGDTDQVGRDASLYLFFVWQLLCVRG